MRAVMLEVDPKLLAERARLGLDRWDEMWDGELHMVPAPTGDHQRFGSQLVRLLGALAEERGLIVSYETGFYRAADDYRIPDLAVYRPDQASGRGIEGAELVVEIRSPRDESMAKLPWYLARGCREVLMFDEDTLAVELYDAGGRRDPAVSDVLGCTFRQLDGPAVEVAWDAGTAILRHR